MKRSVIAVAILPIAAANTQIPSTAAEEYGQKIAVCTAKADIDGQQCLAELLAPVSEQLNRTLEAALVVAANEKRSAELRQAQASWVKFVDAQCDFDIAQYRDGTGHWSVGYICRIERTAIRIDELNHTAGQ